MYIFFIIYIVRHQDPRPIQAHTGLGHRPNRKVQLPCALLETSLMYKQVLGIEFQEVIG